MTWIPETHMTDVHIIRQDYARAKALYQSCPWKETKEALEEQEQRRARAIRMIHREDGASVRHLAAMFRIPKNTVKAALAAGTDT